MVTVERREGVVPVCQGRGRHDAQAKLEGMYSYTGQLSDSTYPGYVSTDAALEAQCCLHMADFGMF